MITSIPRRVAATVAAFALGLSVLTGCSSEGAETDCSLDACTVTFDRGVEARAEVLGIEAKLISAQNDQVTLEVAGEQISLTVGQAATQVAGMNVAVQSADDKKVVVLISR